MSKARDLIGQQFGRLEVIACLGLRAVGKQAAMFWRCRCKCGKVREVRGGHLIGGKIVSCGCFRADPNVRRLAAFEIPPDVRKARSFAGYQALAGRLPKTSEGEHE